MDNNSALAAVGLSNILTYIFAFLPAVVGIAFLAQRFNRQKISKTNSLLPFTAAAAGLIQLIISGPILSEQVSSPLLRTFPVKTVDYAGYNLVAGIIIFVAIIVCWRKSLSQSAKNDNKLAIYLTVIVTLTLTVQISEAIKYGRKTENGNQALFSQQLDLAQGFGALVYKVDSLNFGNVKLDGGLYENNDGQIIYTQYYVL